MAALLKKNGHNPDYFLMGIVSVLSVFGLLILSSASSDLGQKLYGDSYYFLKHQLLSGFLPGVILAAAAYFFSYHRYKKIALYLLLINIVLLVLVFTPLGAVTRNTNRWLSFGPITFQPSEILKITFIMYLAAWLSNSRAGREKKIATGLLPLLIIFGIVGTLLILQPATSVVFILFSAGLAVYFMSGARFRYIGLIVAIAAAAVTVVVINTPYRMKRIATYIDPTKDTKNTGYHINQSLLAIRSGGLFGQGYGQSLAKLGSLPTPMDDSIFAVAAQELGFVGGGGLIVLFAMLVLRMFWLAKNMRDKFGRLLLVGFATIIAVQSVVNIAAISNVLPLTGVPLPFISNGGTALAIFLAMMGISVNISRFSQ